MVAKENRKLAHRMLDELEEEEILEIIEKMQQMKGFNSKVTDEKGFPISRPTLEELEALKKGKKEFNSGESYTHEDVFGEEDYV